MKIVGDLDNTMPNRANSGHNVQNIKSREPIYVGFKSDKKHASILMAFPVGTNSVLFPCKVVSDLRYHPFVPEAVTVP